MCDCLYFGENIQVDRYVWVQASHIASALPKTIPREEPGSSQKFLPVAFSFSRKD